LNVEEEEGGALRPAFPTDIEAAFSCYYLLVSST